MIDIDPQTLCGNCEGAFLYHHGRQCDCHIKAEQEYWAKFQLLPDYCKTREAIVEMELNQPSQCLCRGFVKIVPTNA